MTGAALQEKLKGKPKVRPAPSCHLHSHLACVCLSLYPTPYQAVLHSESLRPLALTLAFTYPEVEAQNGVGAQGFLSPYRYSHRQLCAFQRHCKDM